MLDTAPQKKEWIFLVNVFDVTLEHSKWLGKLSAKGYDTLILINRFANFIKTIQKREIVIFKIIRTASIALLLTANGALINNDPNEFSNELTEKTMCSAQRGQPQTFIRFIVLIQDI